MASREFTENLATAMQADRPGITSAQLAKSMYEQGLGELRQDDRNALQRFQMLEEILRNEWKALREVARSAPDTVGAKVEEAWMRCLRSVLSDDFPIVQHGHIVDSEGRHSPQIDILVLRPGYPHDLFAGTHYPPEVVLAGFECKLTLTTGNVAEAVRKSMQIKEMFACYEDDMKGELRSPLVYGLVTLGQSLKNVEKSLHDSVHDALVAAGVHAAHPRHLLDLVVVPGELCMSLTHDIDKRARIVDCGYEYVEVNVPHTAPADNALGRFFVSLIDKLPYRDPKRQVLRDALFLFERYVCSMYRGGPRWSWDTVFSERALASDEASAEDASAAVQSGTTTSSR